MSFVRTSPELIERAEPHIWHNASELLVTVNTKVPMTLRKDCVRCRSARSAKGTGLTKARA